MSCENCEDNPIRGAFYRWSRANVEIIACEEHWKQIRDALNKAQGGLPDDPEKPVYRVTEK